MGARMDATQRQIALQEEIKSVMQPILDTVIEKVGNNIFNACDGWAFTYDPLALVPRNIRGSVRKVLSLTRGLTIPTEEIPGVWQILVDHLDGGRRELVCASAKKLLSSVSFGLESAHESAFAVLVCFLHVAVQRYRDEGLPVLSQNYQIMLGPPGPGRIGIVESLVHGAKRSQRVTGERTIAKILETPIGSPISPGWRLSSLIRHVKQVHHLHAKVLSNLCSALPLPNSELSRLILAGFEMNNLDYVAPAEEAPAADAQALALLNQLSEMYV